MPMSTKTGNEVIAELLEVARAAVKLCVFCGGTDQVFVGDGSLMAKCDKCAGLRTAIAKADGIMSNPQSMPTPGREPVAPSLKEAFAQWIDKRTALGIAKYGHGLETCNGRDVERDATEELLDFCQYQHQKFLEIRAEREQWRQDKERMQGAYNVQATILEATIKRWEIAECSWRQEQGELKVKAKHLAEALWMVSNSCPCGARGESPQTHPHVIGCLVELALIEYRKAVAW